jgi:hypothetical protein
MYCYCIKNIINEKRYIGITRRPLNERLNQHVSDLNKGLDFIFYRAMRKYGISNFILEWSTNFLNQCNEEELQEIEKFYIEKYRTFIKFKDCKGYNMTLGCEGRTSNGKKVIQYDLNCNKIKEYDTISEAARINDLSFQNISKCCHKKRKSTGKYMWLFVGDTPKKYKNKSQRTVYQWNIVTKELIRIHEGIMPIAKQLGINYTSIVNCCRKRGNIAAGFKWSYDNVFPEINEEI